MYFNFLTCSQQDMLYPKTNWLFSFSFSQRKACLPPRGLWQWRQSVRGATAPAAQEVFLPTQRGCFQNSHNSSGRRRGRVIVVVVGGRSKSARTASEKAPLEAVVVVERKLAATGDPAQRPNPVRAVASPLQDVASRRRRPFVGSLFASVDAHVTPPAIHLQLVVHPVGKVQKDCKNDSHGI